MKSAIISIILLTTGLLWGQDGGQLYATYCAACHGEQGQGNPAAGMPPLAGSEWVLGTPERAINIVLHGVNGPIEVAGKAYNLVMPGQGAVLDDAKISGILNYVRTNWGNTEKEKMTADMVKAVRDKTPAGQTILKQFPLPVEKSPLTLTEVLVGFEEEAPNSYSGEEIPRLVDIGFKKVPKKGLHTLIYKGEFEITETVDYRFYSSTTFDMNLKLGGKTVFNFPRGRPFQNPLERVVKLAPGKHAFELTLKTKSRRPLLNLDWKHEKMKEMKSLVLGSQKKSWDTIELKPTSEVLIYRNYFNDNDSPNGIAVGSPKKFHFCFDAVHLAPSMLWKGYFIDAGRHWTQRGIGNVNPLAYPYVKLGHVDQWKTADKPIQEKSYRGYSFDEDRLGVTFHYHVGKSEFSDHYRAREDGLHRTLKRLSGVEEITVEVKSDDFPGYRLSKPNGDSFSNNSLTLQKGACVTLIYNLIAQD